MFISVVFCILLAGCQSDRVSNPQSLTQNEISIEDMYNEASFDVFMQSKYRGIVQYDYVGQPEAAIGAKTISGGFTQICGQIEYLDIWDPSGTAEGPPGDINWLTYPLLELRAFPKEDVKENCYVMIGLEKYRFKELQDFMIFETENLCIYDLMFFDSEQTYEDYIRKTLQPMLDTRLEDNPEFSEDDYIQLMIDLRSWLIDRLQTDFPISD